jgi:formamidopyrimidine-DNA glycosylase
MPELPEVETIKRELESSVPGKKISRVLVHDPRVIREPAPGKFTRGLEGKTINGVLRRAKVLILELSGGNALVMHLKMTGQLIYPGKGEGSKVSFEFSDGSMLDFNDTRVFAELRLLDDWKKLKFIRELGPEPFEVTAEQFGGMLARRATKIKVLLMDQTVISGIGNLYAAEILFAARIDPRRPANSLSGAEKEKLFKAMREVLAAAIQHKGSSVDRYVQLSGKPGGYVPYHKVYGREGKPCQGCGGTVRRIALGGRGTYFCPSCQK